MSARLAFVLALCTALSACGSEAPADERTPAPPERAGDDDTTLGCHPEQSPPYAALPWVGIHGNAANSDWVDCATAPTYQADWHALHGLALTQPNTFSPDGTVVYATTSHPEPDGCRLHALDVATGVPRWCRSFPPSISLGAAEVDAEGALYFTVDSEVVSLTPDGELRWRRALTDAAGAPDAPYGLHLTPKGLVATVTASGVVVLLDRATGIVRASLDIPAVWGFVPPEVLEFDVDLAAFLPEAVQQDIAAIWGEGSVDEAAGAFGSFMGSGAFSDNTLGISEAGDIYVIGGGEDPEHGALVQVRVVGDAAAPRLEAGWFLRTVGGSATSPSISSGDHFVVVSDGGGPASLLGNATAEVIVANIAACDANTDADPDPDVCAPAFSEPLERGAMPGSPAILPDGTVIFWEMSLGFEHGPEARDVVAVGPDGILWEVALPANLEWSSALTVTRDHIVGTGSRVQRSSVSLAGVTLPQTTDDRLVLLDRHTGLLLWQARIPDDGAASVSVGPDGSLYVAMLGALSIMALDDRPTLGLLRFRPVDPALAPLPPPLDEPDLGDGSATAGHDDPTGERPDDGDPTGDDPDDAGATGDPADGEGDDPGESAPDPDAPCIDVDIDTLDPCCAADAAHCVPMDLIAESFLSLVDTCDDGGACVPDAILASRGAIELRSCESLGGAAGACLSLCVPRVAEMSGLLPQDVCTEGEACVPCIDPLTGEDTGVCGSLVCGGGSEPDPGTPTDPDVPAEGSGEEPPASTPPPSCCAGWGTCLDPALIPDDQEGNLKDCRAEGHQELMCVPNELLDPSWLPDTCVGTGIFGGTYDGVCLPDCLRIPLEFAFDGVTCGEGFVCVPCVDPTTGIETGALGCE